MYQYVSEYKKQEIQTASPGKLIVMLYDGAIRNLQSAKAAYEDKNIELKVETIAKAQEIILELMGALDFEKGGKIAKNLNVLYSYVLSRMRDADFRRDISGIDESVKILTRLREAWEQIVKEQTQSQTQERFAQTG